MTLRSPRLAALIAVVITPAAAVLAVAFAITIGPGRSIARGPLENGEKIGRSRAWLAVSGFYPAELDQAVVRIERLPDTVQRDHVDSGFRLSPMHGIASEPSVSSMVGAEVRNGDSTEGGE